MNKRAPLIAVWLIIATIVALPMFVAGSKARANSETTIGVVVSPVRGGWQAKKLAKSLSAALEDELRAPDVAVYVVKRHGRDGQRDFDYVVTVEVEVKGDSAKATVKLAEGKNILRSVIVEGRRGSAGFTDDVIASAKAGLGEVYAIETAPKQPPRASGRTIRSRGVGIMPIQRGNAALARRGAVVLAERDAAERGLGAVVELSVIPEQQQRQVITELHTKLSNVNIIADERQGDVYVIELEADVLIPAEIAELFPPPAPPESAGMKPALQLFKNGRVNWESGVIEATGRGRLGGSEARDIELARRAARVDAYAVAMEIIKGVNFDPDSTVEYQLAQMPRRSYRIRGLVQGAKVIDSGQQNNGFYRVSIAVPMRGLKGVSIAFKDLWEHQPASMPPWLEEPEPTPAEEKTTGLIIDARGAGLMPAMNPVVTDPLGAVVYGAGDVEPQSYIQRGAAAYVTGEPLGSEGARLGPNPLRIEALRVETAPLQIASLAFASWTSLPKAIIMANLDRLIAQATARVSLRQGDNPVTVKAKAATGSRRAMVVVSSSSASKIRKTNKKTNYLSQARVVIITDSMVGATEGRKTAPGQNRLALGADRRP